MTERDKIVEIVARASEAVILRRFHAKRIDGYTLKMAQEIGAAALAALEKEGYAVVKKPSDLDRILKDVEAAAKFQSSPHFHEIHRGNVDMANALVELARALAASSPKE
jgi:hypothetical protein